ncbi:hypothetical protein MLD38_011057 [Melastoma candidum]|uniref:Uncharacterized protein n=1 Tax=Melastoma candidum TaxID=119954 RepID=A0ACB9R5Z8_9MYRT|nr:hypothetical protein MLD38_011057 [Melastoma candidum]
MVKGSQAFFSALDNAKTQRYHFKAIVIAGMGFFTDAYDLFCITAVTKLIGRLYYPDPTGKGPGTLPLNINNAITGVALCGTLAGQLFFGWLRDKLGQKKVYGITLVTMVGCAVASGLSFGSTPESVIATLCFFRFWLGFGNGGDYPLSAVIMSEYANQKTRGGFVAAVFAMQGVGILFAGAVAMFVSKMFLLAFHPPFHSVHEASTQRQEDFVWRIVLMFGAVPAALTYYWRQKMPETASSGHPANPKPSYDLWSAEFLKRHGLLGTASTWLLLDIAFYSLNLAQKDVYPVSRMVPKAGNMNAIEEVFYISKAMFIIALVAQVPGYWFTVFLIDKVGRFYIQLGGFLFMSVFMAVLGFRYEELTGKKCPECVEHSYSGGHPVAFIALLSLTLLFSNFGPNSTTFIVPAELFPARFRSTCHGISAAAGKAGAIIGAFWIQTYTQNPKGIKKVIKVLAVVNMLGFALTFLLPETKGRTLEEISGEDMESDEGVTTGRIRDKNDGEAASETEMV